jgi:desumoylating isopeptidase 1
LYCYDISKSLFSIWHTSIVIFGIEFSFGSNGVTISYTPGTPDKIEPMGRVSVTKPSFFVYIDELQKEYTAEMYSLMIKNCNCSAGEICDHFGLRRLPSYIKRQLRAACTFTASTARKSSGRHFKK